MQILRYSFYDETNGQYVGAGDSGIVYSGSPIYTAFDPKDWSDTKASLGRNVERGGLFRKDSSPSIYTKDGAHICRHYFYTYGVHRKLKLIVDRRQTTNPLSVAFIFYFSAYVDFGVAVNNPENDNTQYFNVNLIELGIQSKIDANEDTTYEIPINNSAIPVLHEGITLQSNYNYIPTPENISVDNNANPNTVSGQSSIFFEVEGEYEVGQAFNTAAFSNQSFTSPVLAGATFDNAKMFIANQDMKIQLDVVQDLRLEWEDVGGNSVFELMLLIADKDKNIVHYAALTYQPGSAYMGTLQSTPTVIQGVVKAKSAQISVTAGSRLFYFYRTFGGNNGGIDVTIYGNSTTSIDNIHIIRTEFKLAPTTLRAYRPFDLLVLVCSKMGITSVTSDFLSSQNLITLDNTPYNTLLTSADAVRNIDNAVIKVSFKTLMQFFRSAWCLGDSVEGGNTLRVEQMGYFYNKSAVSYVAPINGVIKTTMATDLMYNRIKVGYQTSNRDTLNGKFAFNCQHEYTCGIESPAVTKDLNLVSDVITDQYTIEEIRSYLHKKKTTSAEEDERIVALEIGTATEVINTVTHYKLKYATPAYSSGTPFPATDYNVGLSPKRSLIRNLPMIASFLLNGQVIIFQSATQSKSMVYGQNALQSNKRVSESGNIMIIAGGATNPGISGSYLFNRLFKPYYFEAEALPPINLLALPDADLYKLFGVVDDRRNVLYGFIVDIGTYPATDNVYLTKLLCSPDQDLTSQIHG